MSSGAKGALAGAVRSAVAGGFWGRGGRRKQCLTLQMPSTEVLSPVWTCSILVRRRSAAPVSKWFGKSSTLGELGRVFAGTWPGASCLERTSLYTGWREGESDRPSERGPDWELCIIGSGFGWRPCFPVTLATSKMHVHPSILRVMQCHVIISSLCFPVVELNVFE